MRTLSIVLTALALQACGGECELVPDGPSRVAFDDGVIGEQVLSVVRIANTCEDALSVSGVSVAGSDAFTINEGVDSLPGLGEGTVAIAFTPPDYRQHLADLQIDTANGPVEVVLSGLADPDQDGDGVNAFAAGGTDCDDTDPEIVEAREEEVNGRDDDCDGFVDEDFIEAGDIVITELMLTPTVGAPAGQWVEIQNRGRLRADLTGWTLSGPSGRYTIGPGVVVREGERVVVGFEADTSLNGGVELTGLLTGSPSALPTQGWFMSLSVDGRAIHVLTGNRWPEEAGRSIGADPEVNNPAEASSPDAWCTALTPTDGGDFATPGQRNDLCPQYDHDGDGLSGLEGDCDDTDATINPIAPDIWDEIDNNCDGIVDLMLDQAAASGVIQGDNDRFGQSARLVGPDLVVTSNTGFSSRLYRFTAADSLDALLLSAPEAATGILTETGSERRGEITGTTPLFDADGDGDDDVVVLGKAPSFYREDTLADYLWLYDGLPDEADPPWTNDDAILIVEDPRDGKLSQGVQAVVDLDLDGDGTADPVFGHGSYQGYIDGFDRTTKGRVVVLDLIDASGQVSFDDIVTLSWTGETEQTGAGDALAGGDLNDDGYDDIVVMDVDPSSMMTTDRRVQVLSGGMELASGTLEGSASLVITGVAGRSESTFAPIGSPLVGDVDDDGVLDLVVPDPYAAKVHIFSDTTTLSGEVAVATADLTLTGADLFGYDVATGDVSGDGTPWLLVGQPKSGFGGGGSAWLFAPDVLQSTGEVANGASIAGFASSQSRTYGSIVGLWDVSGDGRDDVVIADPYSFSNNGGVFLYAAP